MTKCKDSFDIRVRIKCQYLRSNQSPFMKKKRFQKLSWILKRLIINCGANACRLFKKLSETTTIALFILPIKIILEKNQTLFFR